MMLGPWAPIVKLAHVRSTRRERLRVLRIPEGLAGDPSRRRGENGCLFRRTPLTMRGRPERAKRHLPYHNLYGTLSSILHIAAREREVLGNSQAVGASTVTRTTRWDLRGTPERLPAPATARCPRTADPEVLARIRPFNDLDDCTVRRLAATAISSSYRRGDVIARTGLRESALHALVAGRA